MKFLIVFILTVATALANIIPPFEKPVHPKDLPQTFDVEGRIINGFPAYPAEFPYQVGLSFIGSHYWMCGGSLIGSEWVLTAAHCTNGASSVLVYLGVTVRKGAKPTFTVSNDKFRQHSGFNPSKPTNNDISLIRIPAVVFTNEIQRIAIPKLNEPRPTYAGKLAVVTGWGETSYGDIADNLQYTHLRVIENSECKKTWGTIVNSGILCVNTTGGTATCHGDSGGPLVLLGTRVLIGIVSFGSPSCQLGIPAGFTRVTNYLTWIFVHTGIAW